MRGNYVRFPCSTAWASCAYILNGFPEPYVCISTMPAPFYFPPLAGTGAGERCRFLIRPDKYAMAFLRFTVFFRFGGTHGRHLPLPFCAETGRLNPTENRLPEERMTGKTAHLQ